jgi:hypothetical protein
VGRRTVSQIWSLMGLLSMVIMRAPNSTPMVRSCTGWNRLSVNCSSRHDFPTPANTDNKAASRAGGRVNQYRSEQRSRSPAERIQSTRRSREERRTCVADDDVLEEVGVRHARLVGRSRQRLRRSSGDSWGGGEAEDSIWFAGRFDEGGGKVRVGEGGTLQLMATRPVPNQEP